MASWARAGEGFRGDCVTAVGLVDHDPVRDDTDHAQTSAVLSLLVLVLDPRGHARASVVRDRQGDHLRGYCERQVETAGLSAAGRVEDRVRAQLAHDQLGKTWQECDTNRWELLAKVDQGVPVPTRSAKLSEWLPYWLDNVIKPRRKLSTYDKYEAHVRLYLVPLLGAKRLESLGVADVRRFLIRLEKQTTAATTASRPRARTRSTRPSCLPSPWASAVARSSVSAGRTSTSTTASCTSASRPSAAVASSTTTNPKSRRHRAVPLRALCIAPLRWHRMRQAAARTMAGERWHESGYVCTTRTGRQVEARNVYRSFTRIAESAGIRVIRLHDARHGTATLLTAAGVAPAS